MRTTSWRIGLLVSMVACGCESEKAAPSPTKTSPAEKAEPDTKVDPSVLPDPGVPPGPDGYRFSRDLFSDRIPVWSRVLAPFKGKPNLNYLEVGVFEGQAVVWMFDNILTDPSSKATGVDIFPENLEAIFRANVERSGHTSQVTVLKGLSQVELRKLAPESFDVIYIDGSHTADDVLADAVLAWTTLKPGGVVIFDDFLWVGRGSKELLPAELRPSLAIASFITSYRSYIEVLENDYQVVLKKIENPCPSKHYCSPIGQYVYSWRDKALSRPDGSRVELSEPELHLIERIAHAKGFGESGFTIDEALSASPGFAELQKRLELKLPAAVTPLADKDRANLIGIGTCRPE